MVIPLLPQKRHQTPNSEFITCQDHLEHILEPTFPNIARARTRFTQHIGPPCPARPTLAQKRPFALGDPKTPASLTEHSGASAGVTRSKLHSASLSWPSGYSVEWPRAVNTPRAQRSGRCLRRCWPPRKATAGAKREQRKRSIRRWLVLSFVGMIVWLLESNLDSVRV